MAKDAASENLDLLIDLLKESVTEKESSSEPQPRKILSDPQFESEIQGLRDETSDDKSLIRSDLVNSLDDEEERNHSHKYNECGRNIKAVLSEKNENRNQFLAATFIKDTWKSKNVTNSSAVANKVETSFILGVRVSNPLISSAILNEKMGGRELISFANIKKHVEFGDTNKNWVVCGAIVSKSEIKTSQKGNKYLIWTLSDLHSELKSVALFLFGGAYKNLWKISQGTVVAILNPSTLANSNTKQEATLSIDNSDRALILGPSKDLGFCKTKKKNGDICDAFINKSKCEFCIYHIKQEYRKFSSRPDLQSNSRGLDALRNKVLGKNEVFYAGKSFMAVPSKKNTKQIEKDKKRLDALMGFNKTSVVNKKQQLKDSERLKTLNANPSTSEISTEESKRQAVAVINKLKQKKTQSLPPKLSCGNAGIVDLSTTVKKKVTPGKQLQALANQKLTQPSQILSPKTLSTPSQLIAQLKGSLQPQKLDTSQKFTLTPKTCLTQSDNFIEISPRLPPQLARNRGRMKALQFIAKNGPIQNCASKKRPLETTTEESAEAKRFKEDSKRELYKKIMEAKSINEDLVVKCDNDAQEKYFLNLERKEQMEEKMAKTFKMTCKAVKCLKCKYINFSASDLCKSERHPLKVFDTVKRFYKCGNCSNRTVTLELIPLKECSKCGGKSWQKCGMINEKIATMDNPLSIRGGEETFLGGNIVNANLNLLIP